MVIGDGLVLHLLHTVMLGGQECEELYCEEMLLHLACVVTGDGVRLSPLYAVCRVVGTLPLGNFHTDGTNPRRTMA